MTLRLTEAVLSSRVLLASAILWICGLAWVLRLPLRRLISSILILLACLSILIVLILSALLLLLLVVRIVPCPIRHLGDRGYFYATAKAVLLDEISPKGWWDNLTQAAAFVQAA